MQNYSVGNELKQFFITDFITGLLNSIGTHVDPIINYRTLLSGPPSINV